MNPRNTPADRDEKLQQLAQAIRKAESGNGESQLFDHQADEAAAEVRRRALLLLDQRARSRFELRQRLLALDLEAPVIDSVLEDFAQAGLINDRDFAAEWVRQRHQRRGKSAKVLDLELRDKGVDSVIRAEALSQIRPDDEREMARRVAEKKARSEKVIPSDRREYDKALRRVVSAVARRGFPQGLCMELGRAALDERLAELQE